MNTLFIKINLLFTLLTAALFARDEFILQYDKGFTGETLTLNEDGWYFTTRFTPPANVLLAKARFYIADTSNGATFDFSIYQGGIAEPAEVLVDKVPMRAKKLGWNEIDLTSYHILRDYDFYLSIEFDGKSNLTIGADKQEPLALRSFDSDC